MEALRGTPLKGPGALTRRRNRLRDLADQALGLHGRSPATGEDLVRLAELCVEGGLHAEAVAAATAYLDAAPTPPPPPASVAHALRVRALVAADRIADAEAALAPFRKAFPAAEGLGPILKLVGDGLVEAGRVEDALVRYREAVDLLPKPLRPGAPGTIQALAEALAALGRVPEARRAVEAGLAASKDGAGTQRLEAVLRRLDLQGKPFEPPPADRWLLGAAPEPGALRGKVVAWHFHTWWMEARAEVLPDWKARRAAPGGKDLVVLPLCRTEGWDPAEGRAAPAGRKADDEAADIRKSLEARGWDGPAGLYVGDAAYKALRIRGLPMEVVVGRDGLVRLATAGSEAGHALAVRAALAALAEAAPAAGTPPPAPAPAPAPASPPAGDGR
jgi:tetratricopeptide (TPR) repeat protein